MCWRKYFSFRIFDAKCKNVVPNHEFGWIFNENTISHSGGISIQNLMLGALVSFKIHQHNKKRKFSIFVLLLLEISLVSVVSL